MNDNVDVKETKKYTNNLLRTYRSLLRTNGAPDVVVEIDRAVSACDQLEREILTKKYLIKYANTDIALYIDMHVSESTFYRRLESALIQFAEAYSGGELLVYKSNMEGREEQ